MRDSSATFGAIAGAADDHVGNPAFYVHGNMVLKSIKDKEVDSHEAMEDLFLFLYTAVLDLHRKLMYMYRATRPYLSPNTPFSQAEHELLRTIALHHEQVERAKPRRDEDAMDKNRELIPRKLRPYQYEVIEVLEKHVHELWAEHQESWHHFMERITGVKLTRPADRSTLEDELGRRRSLLGTNPHHRKAEHEDFLKNRIFCEAAAKPRRYEDGPDEDHTRTGERKTRVGAP